MAGDAIMHFYDQDYQNPESVSFKTDNSPVTRADKISHQIIDEELRKLDPAIPVLSEEGMIIPFEERQKYRRLWIVDPLDGTREFIDKNGEFTIHIGLVESGNPILGVVYAPATRTMWWGVKRGGSFRGDIDGIHQLKVNSLDMKSSGIKITHSRSHMDKATDIYIRSFDKPTTIPMGSSLKFMKIAEGEFDIYPKMSSKMKEWDTCAPQIILEEAGGMVVCVEKGRPLEYNKEELTQPDFLAMGNLIAYYEY